MALTVFFLHAIVALCCIRVSVLNLQLLSSNSVCVCVFYIQRAAQQLKAQRQLEEAFESRLQRIQTNMQTTNTQTVTLASSDSTLSADTNRSSGKQPVKQLLCSLQQCFVSYFHFLLAEKVSFMYNLHARILKICVFSTHRLLACVC